MKEDADLPIRSYSVGCWEGLHSCVYFQHHSFCFVRSSFDLNTFLFHKMYTGTHTQTTSWRIMLLIVMGDTTDCICFCVLLRKQTTERRGRKPTVSISMPCDGRELHHGRTSSHVLLRPPLHTPSSSSTHTFTPRLISRANKWILICPKMFLFDILQSSGQMWNIYVPFH